MNHLLGFWQPSNWNIDNSFFSVLLNVRSFPRCRKKKPLTFLYFSIYLSNNFFKHEWTNEIKYIPFFTYLIQFFFCIPHIFFLGCSSGSVRSEAIWILKIQIVARTRQNFPTWNHGHRTCIWVLEIAAKRKKEKN